MSLLFYVAILLLVCAAADRAGNVDGADEIDGVASDSAFWNNI